MQKYVELIAHKLELDKNLVLKKAIRGLPGITVNQLLSALISSSNVEDAAKLLGYTINPVKESIRSVLLPKFPTRIRSFNDKSKAANWRYTLLNLVEYKLCGSCSRILSHSCFTSDISKSDNLSSICSGCNTAKSKQNKLNIIDRTPIWSDIVSIKEFYTKCPEGHEVDHIIPLNGKDVSGLHVLNNLQYLPVIENRVKSNKYLGL